MFIHIRLGDVIHYNPGLEYYVKALSQISFNIGYITSDTPDHPICIELTRIYPNLQIVYTSITDTIHFGSTCKYLV